MARMIRSLLLGTLAGAVGTLCMDLVWFRRYRASGGTQEFVPWETSEGTTGYKQAAAPARTAEAVAALAGVELPDSSARAVNNAVHWLTGLTWGQAHGLMAAMTGWSNPVLGLGTAVTAWGTSYAVLPRLGVYEQLADYEPEVLWKDLSAHLAYGAAVGLTYRLLTARN
jgi:hypothetical protein